MTDWGALTHAYGSAADIPGLLAAAAADADDRAAWDGLWSRLCHQGTAYSASFPALSALTAIALGHPPASYVEPLHLAAVIVASNDSPEDFDTIRRDYTRELSTLRDLAERSLPLASGSREYVYGLQALMAFEGAAPWSRELEALADEELTLECPSCHEYLTVSFESTPATTTALDDSVPSTAVTPANPALLRGPTARLHELARRHGRVAVSDGMLSLFGSTTCPACGIVVDLPTALTD